MASCDVQSTPSQEELKQKETIKNVKNSEERDQAKASSQDEMTAAVAMAAAAAIETDPSPISEGEVRSVSSAAKMTKIPGPVLPGPSGSFIQTTKRHYSSVLRLAKSHTSVESGKDLERDQNQSIGAGKNTTDDSGINMEFSISDVEPSCSTESGPILETILQAIPTTTSELELELAEQQTLKELQRVVAEMEADVALDDQEEMQQDETHSDEEPIFEVLPEVEAAVEEEAHQEVIQNSLGYAELKSLHEPDPGPAEKSLEESVKLEEFEPSQALFEQLDSEASTEKPTTSGGGALPKSFIEEQLRNSVEESIVDPCLERAKQLLEELQVALRAAPETNEEKFTRENLENSDPTSPAGFLGQKFPHQVQVDEATEVVPEVASTEVADEDLSATSEVALVERPSQVSHMDGSVGSDRRMVRLEQLLDAERNVELLRQLLQGGPDVDEAASDMITDTEAYSEETDSIADEVDDDEDENENVIVNGVEVASEDTEEILQADSETEKPSSFLFAMMQRLAGNKMAQLSYPLLFCGLAFSLIYLSRKV